MSSSYAVPFPWGRHGARAVLSPRRARGPLPMLGLGGRVAGYLHRLHFSLVFQLRSACLLVSIGSCLAQTKVRLQRAIFVSAACGAAYFLLALYSTCNLKIYLFTISAAEVVALPVFSLKPASSPGSFCYLPNFFYFDNIFLPLHKPCENCKYSKSIPSCFLC